MANYDFPPTSRYYNVDTAVLTNAADDTQLTYLRRRFLPPSRRLAMVLEHVVSGNERLDAIAAQKLGDAELFWRLCDANDALNPDDLVAAVGRRLRVTLPEGAPGITGV